MEVIAYSIDEAEEKIDTDVILTHFGSEKVLSKDWSSIEKDAAWQNL